MPPRSHTALKGAIESRHAERVQARLEEVRPDPALIERRTQSVVKRRERILRRRGRLSFIIKAACFLVAFWSTSYFAGGPATSSGGASVGSTLARGAGAAAGGGTAAESARAYTAALWPASTDAQEPGGFMGRPIAEWSAVPLLGFLTPCPSVCVWCVACAVCVCCVRMLRAHAVCVCCVRVLCACCASLVPQS